MMNVEKAADINGSISAVGSVDGKVDAVGNISGNLDITGAGNVRPYRGEYEFTPTQQEQIIPIEGLKATEDIIINPIPSNYGLITWNGSTLTVS